MCCCCWWWIAIGVKIVYALMGDMQWGLKRWKFLSIAMKEWLIAVDLCRIIRML